VGIELPRRLRCRQYPGKPGGQENHRNAKQAIGAGWDSEWENTEGAFAPEVELWMAFVSEKIIIFVELRINGIEYGLQIRLYGQALPKDSE
jgi:hypothetical protein